MRSVALALTCITLVGCATMSAKEKAFIGTWTDEPKASGTTYQVEKVKGRATVTRIVDYDDEVFDVIASGMRGDDFVWSYRVPSTGYVVEIVATLTNNWYATYTWSNTDQDGRPSSGTGEMSKAKE